MPKGVLSPPPLSFSWPADSICDVYNEQMNNVADHRRGQLHAVDAD